MQLFNGPSPVCPARVSVEGPTLGRCSQNQVYIALVALCLNCGGLGTPSPVLTSECAGPVHFGCDSMDAGAPAEVFCQLHTEVHGLLDVFKNMTMEGVFDDNLLSVSGDCQDMALVNIECHQPVFLPTFKLVQIFLEYAGVFGIVFCSVRSCHLQLQVASPVT